MVRAIQSEWIFLQHVTLERGEALSGMENIIRETFLPRLFFGNKKNMYPVVGALSTMMVKKSVLVLLNPVTSAQEKYLSSTQGSA